MTLTDEQRQAIVWLASERMERWPDTHDQEMYYRHGTAATLFSGLAGEHEVRDWMREFAETGAEPEWQVPMYA